VQLLAVIDTSILSLGMLLAIHSVLGLGVGSFISMLSWRLPRHLESDTPELLRTLVFDRSHCDNCNKPLKAKQLIPLLSWLLGRGKASCCGTSISVRYPLTEIATALLSLFTAWHFFDPNAPLLGLTLQGWAALVFVWTLISISVIDFEHYLIPDRLSLPLLWLGLLLNSTDAGFVNLSEAVWGAAIGYVSLWLIFQIHRAITGKEGMGYGDFKLTAALGAWLGVQALIPIFILAGGLAIVVMGSFMLLKKHDLANAFPFGPWLAGAGLLVLLGLDPMGYLR
jgi:leader peptidase (prepilin peptidase)/N-methyltransferase